jgi:hypothetical protein
LLLSMCVLGSACQRDPARQAGDRRSTGKFLAAPKPVLPTEIIVKLREKDDRRLRTEVSGSDTSFVYSDGVRLTEFDQLRATRGVRIRQSFPEFSRRWEAERKWRSPGDDQAAIDALGRVLVNCDDAGRPARQVRELIQRWERSRAALREHPGADSAIVRLLQGEDPLAARSPKAGAPPTTRSTADAVLVERFIRALREGGRRDRRS